MYREAAGSKAVSAECVSAAQPVETADSYFRAYGPDLLSFLRRRLRDTDQARDLLQTVFERLFIKLSMSRDIQHPRAFLFQIARNALVDAGRRDRARDRYEEESPLQEAVDNRSPEQILLHRECLSQLATVIAALPPKRRRIFILSRLHHLSLAEIAQREHMSRRAVRGHVERALAQIRAAMDMGPNDQHHP